ncbi:hypothetical protein FPZ43_04165 [Mucilaginibacter pallidiroseus]|uniref:N-acetylneuraminate epimerase n=1 Tax=Mucilaginibacter pallidiroseus TaxID=2599295 RepID=A0A563UJW7_9SPHI|nr:kelch repeat-containing protein [Mucilaginibacter pallidiroseus]TWR31674.1 hypothetical protein FPZ43_04165 [Mucilaginibacter pallidiroseus]
MSKNLLVALALAALCFGCKKEPFVPSSANALPGLWKQLADFSGKGRVRAYAFVIGGKAYMVGGTYGSGFNYSPLNDMWEYDPLADKWTKKASYPGRAAEYIRGFTINNRAYMGTGFGNLQLPSNSIPQNKDFWEYDPATDTWTQKADFPGEARENVIGFEVNGAGYMGLGTDNSYTKNFKDFYRYDAGADKWTAVAPYPGKGSFALSAFAINGQGYAGLGAASPDVTANDFWQYIPVENKWVERANFTGKPRAFTSQFVIGTDGYVGQGSTLAATAPDWFKYNTLTDSWIKITNFDGPARYDAVSFSLNDIGYVGTGNPESLADFWKFTPTKKAP